MAAQDVCGQVQWEAKGVIELEGHVAGQGLAVAQAVGFIAEQLQAAIERFLKARFFEAQDFGDGRLSTLQLGEVLAHRLNQGRHKLVHQRVFVADLVGVTHAAAHDPAQHVAPPFVGRLNTIGHEEGCGAQVVSDHAVGDVVVTVRVIVGCACRSFDQLAQQVYVVVVVLAL